jgi:hypothetical protein
MELGEHLEAFFRRQLLKIAVAMAQNHSKSLLGPYECKLQ